MLAFATLATASAAARAKVRPIDEAEHDFICRPMSFPGVLSAAECTAIVRLGVAGVDVTAGLTHPVEGYRVGITRLIEPSAESTWLYRRLADILIQVNQWYRFDISGFLDSLLYCQYPDGGHFDWHLDCGEGRTR